MLMTSLSPDMMMLWPLPPMFTTALLALSVRSLSLLSPLDEPAPEKLMVVLLPVTVAMSSLPVRFSVSLLPLTFTVLLLPVTLTTSVSPDRFTVSLFPVIVTVSLLPVPGPGPAPMVITLLLAVSVPLVLSAKKWIGELPLTGTAASAPVTIAPHGSENWPLTVTVSL